MRLAEVAVHLGKRISSSSSVYFSFFLVFFRAVVMGVLS